MLGHPKHAKSRINGPERVAADRELPFEANVLDPPLVLRQRPRIVPTDERVKPLSLFIDRQTVHPHAGHRQSPYPGRIGQLPHRLADGIGRASPDLLGIPDRPVGMIGVGMESPSRPAPTGDPPTLEVVDDGFEIRGTEIDPQQVVHDPTLSFRDAVQSVSQSEPVVTRISWIAPSGEPAR